MKILVLFDLAHKADPNESYSPEALKEQDKPTEADVLAALQRLGHEAETLAVYDNVPGILEKLKGFAPEVVFNLSESFYHDRAHEPNITALLDPANLKWRDLVSPGISIPTEWGQATFDSLGHLRDSLAALRGRPGEAKTITAQDAARLAAIDTTLRTVNRRLSRFFLDHPLRGKVGAFEGAGYMAKGFYRPTVNSLMNAFNNEERTYYPVNERAIERVIASYTE